MMPVIRWSVLLLLATLPNSLVAAVPALIPLPVSISQRDGEFAITERTVIDGRRGARGTAAYLANVLQLRSGERSASRIRLQLVNDKVLRGPEGYHLSVTPREVLVEAPDPRGLFYGAQTLRQLIQTNTAGKRTIGSIEIRDRPRFRYRGLLIDVSRHFFGKSTILKILDEMAVYKLNVLQLHLTDDPGWRLEVAGYPKLTDIGALDPVTGARQYFTANDIREIVAYAAERHVIVVPEIEMPGHSGSEARAYPEFFDRQGRFNPGKPETYDFILALLTQVAKLFPGPYVHFGGDEVGDDAWEELPEVARLKSEHALKTNHDVQSYFGHRVAAIVESLGKRPMAWDEQAEAGADKDVVIFWWRKGKPEVLEAAAKAGYDLVMAPVDKAYFDYPQGPGEPGAPWEGNEGGPTSIAKILAWEPVPRSFTPEQSSRVLGVEAAVWTEFIASERYLEFMTFPRLLAFAEVAWRPKGSRDDAEFELRLQPHIAALRAKGINARRGEGDAYEFITH